MNESAPHYVARKTCRACDSTGLTHVIDLGMQYLPRFVAEVEHTLPSAPLTLVRCASCGLLQLQHTVDPDLLYREFWYRSAINQSMRIALEEVASAGLRYHSKGSWLDIGANDGYLLSRLPLTFRRVACEPALNLRDDLGEHADAVISDYFNAGLLGGEKFQVITSIAMFYDLDDPNSFVRDVADSLAPGGIWINQLNDSPTMMHHNAFDAICHEHLCYYDLWSLNDLYKKNGLEICSISYNDVNGGSVRVIAARRGEQPSSISALLGVGKVSQTEAEAFARRTTTWRERMREHLFNECRAHDQLWCYGASTKGGTLLQYLNCSEVFAAVADRNPRKHRLRMAGAWIPIKSEEEFRAAKPHTALVLPWAFKREFDAREAATRAAGTAFLYPLPEISLVL